MSEEYDVLKGGGGERDVLKGGGGEPDFEAHQLKDGGLNDEPDADEDDDFEAHVLKPD